jgi:hypothetical protein
MADVEADGDGIGRRLVMPAVLASRVCIGTPTGTRAINPRKARGPSSQRTQRMSSGCSEPLRADAISGGSCPRALTKRTLPSGAWTRSANPGWPTSAASKSAGRLANAAGVVALPSRLRTKASLPAISW